MTIEQATEPGTGQTYEEALATLSEGSVRVNFDPFVDIDWDHPDNAIRLDDPRLKLPKVHPLGGHPWYQSLPEERQIEIGLASIAQMMKVGQHFENLLIRGLMQYVFTLPNGDPEFRYVTHEATEESHHTQMMQEFVNRSGVDAPGIRSWVVPLQGLVPMFATWFPEFFFTMVLGGEEPIDHLQKVYLRTDEDIHPLVKRIISIHVAEEARHISFAHRYLTERAGDLGVVGKSVLSVLYPLTMRIMCDMIVVPERKFTDSLGIPREVIREVHWDSPAGRSLLSETFGDVRLLAENIGLRNPVAKRLWKVLGIDGRPSRFRGETHERTA